MPKVISVKFFKINVKYMLFGYYDSLMTLYVFRYFIRNREIMHNIEYILKTTQIIRDNVSLF